MFDASKLLDQILGAGSQGGQPSRVPASMGSRDVTKRMQDLAQGQYGGLAGGALAGGLATILLGTKSGRKLGKSALKVGGMALLGGLAYKAYSDWQAGRNAQASTVPPTQMLPPPADTPFAELADAGHAPHTGELLIRAMIAAARADGRIDPAETARIREALSKSGLGADAEAFLFEVMGQPDNLERLVAGVDSTELATEVWLAARLAVDPDVPEERAFLDDLAGRLGLPSELVAHLEASAAGVTEAQPVA